MTIESSLSIQPDPEEASFKEKIDEWVAGKVDYEEVVDHIPSHYLSLERRVARSVKRKTTHLISKISGA